MDRQLVDEIIHCQPGDRLRYWYFRDRYALILLGLAAGGGVPVAALKRSPLAGLLHKPMVKNLLAGLGNGLLTRDHCQAVWPADTREFVLTLDRWGGEERAYQQTSRPGYNLVLQLNFTSAHGQAMQRLLKTRERGLFNYQAHPVLRPGEGEAPRDTLAWVRIDLDLDEDEALVEEIQSDWVKLALRWRDQVKRQGRAPRYWWGDAAGLERYCAEQLGDYIRLWSEAMLGAALEFIHGELGINTVYYHSFDTGAALKGIRYNLPPRSLYTELPRRFCFQPSREPPRFLARALRRRLARLGEPWWYRLHPRHLLQHGA